MRIWPGILLLAAGFTGGSLWYADSSLEGLVALAGGSSTAKLADARTLIEEGAAAGGTRFFGAAIQERSASPQAAPQASTPPAVKQPGWSTEVAFRAGPATVVAAPAPARVVAAVGLHQKSDMAQTDLARSLQRELKRVGCYAGEVDGDWGVGSKRALNAFIERMNSAIPTDEPELIHLTLVRGYPGNACRTVPSQPAVLPTSQPGGLITAGRPMPAPAYTISQTRPVVTPPTPVLARAGQTAPTTPEPSLESVAATPPLRPAPFEGRMAVGAMVVGTVAQPQEGVQPDPLAAAAAAQKQRPKPREQQSVRRDHSWTASFFSQ